MEERNFLFNQHKNNIYEEIRLDSYLAKSCKDISRSKLQNLIKEGQVTIQNTKIYTPNYRLKKNSLISLKIPNPKTTKIIPQPMNLNIIYEDNDIIVINKPAGLIVHPGSGNPDKTLLNALLSHCGNDFLNIGSKERLGIVHRLDKDTSGILVIAKNKTSYYDLIKQFTNRSIKRLYDAIIWGLLTPFQGTINETISRNPYQRKKMSVSCKGKNAITHYRVIEYLSYYLSLIECQLETGRTHQIRVHMSSINHPIFADPIYGKPPKTLLLKELKEIKKYFKHQALHAKHLKFIHPLTRKKMSFNCKPPEEFMNLITQIKSFSFINK